MIPKMENFVPSNMKIVSYVVSLLHTCKLLVFYVVSLLHTCKLYVLYVDDYYYYYYFCENKSFYKICLLKIK